MPTQYLVKLDGRPELLLVSASRDSVLWVRDAAAQAAIQTQIALDGGNPDVQTFETGKGDGLGDMIRNLTMLGDMPPGYASDWVGPRLPGDGATTMATDWRGIAGIVVGAILLLIVLVLLIAVA